MTAQAFQWSEKPTGKPKATGCDGEVWTRAVMRNQPARPSCQAGIRCGTGNVPVRSPLNLFTFGHFPSRGSQKREANHLACAHGTPARRGACRVCKPWLVRVGTQTLQTHHPGLDYTWVLDATQTFLPEAPNVPFFLGTRNKRSNYRFLLDPPKIARPRKTLKRSNSATWAGQHLSGSPTGGLSSGIV